MSLPVWGVPWHGKVQGGSLTLPNATTRAWPQPDGTSSGSITDHAGYTFLQKLPGVAEIVRTTEEQAADEAAGMEWRDSFIVSGTDTGSTAGVLVWPQVHSKPLGGWIYAAPDGGRWLVKGGGTYSFSQGGTLNIPLRLVRFGDFGGAAVTINLTVSATSSAMGQLTPGVSSTAIKAKVEDITPAGDRAILMLYIGNKTPIGFLLLTLTGTPGVDFVAALSVLQSRAQTLGSLTDSDGVAWARMSAYHTFVRTINDQTGEAPNCGYSEAIDTPVAHIRLPEWWEAANVTVASGERKITITGRILAMWFDAAGTPQPLTLDSAQSYNVDAPLPSNVVSGRVVLRSNRISYGWYCGDGTGGFTEYMSYAMSQTVSEAVVQTATLSYLGQSESVEYRHERTVTQTSSYTGVSSAYQNIAPVSSSGVQTGSRTVTVDGVVVTTISEDATGTNYYAAGPYVGERPNLLFPIDRVPQLRPVTISGVNPGTWMPAIKRWSNTLVGWRTLRDTPAVVCSPAISPKGQKVSENPNAAGLYGSLNPLTGDAVFPSATPVSWT